MGLFLYLMAKLFPITCAPDMGNSPTIDIFKPVFFV